MWAAEVGLLVERKDEPSSLDLGVREGLGTGPRLSLGNLGFGEARLVSGRRATVPGVTGTGRGLYRRQRRASVGRIGSKSTLPTDAPFIRLQPVAACRRSGQARPSSWRLAGGCRQAADEAALRAAAPGAR